MHVFPSRRSEIEVSEGEILIDSPGFSSFVQSYMILRLLEAESSVMPTCGMSSVRVQHQLWIRTQDSFLVLRDHSPD